MPQILISGFTTEAQAKAFIEWYDGQGEQDAEIWFSERKIEGAIDVSFMPVYCKETYPISFIDGVAHVKLRMCE